jgi:hypothetical protein
VKLPLFAESPDPSLLLLLIDEPPVGGLPLSLPSSVPNSLESIEHWLADPVVVTVNPPFEVKSLALTGTLMLQRTGLGPPGELQSFPGLHVKDIGLVPGPVASTTLALTPFDHTSTLKNQTGIFFGEYMRRKVCCTRLLSPAVAPT